MGTKKAVPNTLRFQILGVGVSVFFGRIYAIEGVAKVCALEIQRKFQIFKRFYLRSETVSEEKSQGKNDFFGALRAATTAGRRENKRKSFLILVSSDRKPQKGVLSQN